MMRRALGHLKGEQTTWAQYHDWRRERTAAARAIATREPWDMVVARTHWRLLGHVARQSESSVCHAAIRSGGLWLNRTLRAMGQGRGHGRPDPHRRLDNRVNAFCRNRDIWWVDAAADREYWQELDVSFVDAVAPFQLWELAIRDYIKATAGNRTNCRGSGGMVGDASMGRALPLIASTSPQSTNTDPHPSAGPPPPLLSSTRLSRVLLSCTPAHGRPRTSQREQSRTEQDMHT